MTTPAVQVPQRMLNENVGAMLISKWRPANMAGVTRDITFRVGATLGAVYVLGLSTMSPCTSSRPSVFKGLQAAKRWSITCEASQILS